MGNTIGERIKSLRENLNMTQDDLADACQTSRSTIARYEANAIEPKGKKAVALATALRVSTDVILGVEQPTSAAHSPDQDEVWQLREALRRDPARRTLFDAAANVKSKDIMTAVRLLDALKGDDDGDAL